MCEWGTTIDVMVKVPADLSSTGRTKWDTKKIDSCIADIVRALQQGGIDMRGCCCGHSEHVGDIHLQDGRVLLIVGGNKFFNQRGRLFLGMLLQWVKWYIGWLLRFKGRR